MLWKQSLNRLSAPGTRISDRLVVFHGARKTYGIASYQAKSNASPENRYATIES